jgi:competence protein ComEC
MALRRGGNGFPVAAVRPGGVDRPWSAAVGGDTEAETTLVPGAKSPRAVDATPAEADQQAEE